MATFSKRLLSASTSGKGILVTQAATALDEIWIYATNTHSASIKLTLEWGEATEPNGNIELTVASESGLVLVIPGLLLTGGLVLKAFAAIASEIVLHGYVNRIE